MHASTHEHLDGPAVRGDIHPVAFWIAYPALGYGAKGVRFCFGLRRLFYRRYILDLEPKVVDAPGQLWPADQGYAHETIGQVDSAVGAPVFFLQTEHACIVLSEFLPILDVERDMSDAWFIHSFPP